MKEGIRSSYVKVTGGEIKRRDIGGASWKWTNWPMYGSPDLSYLSGGTLIPDYLYKVAVF